MHDNESFFKMNMDNAEIVNGTAFDYDAAVREIEDILARVEDPLTGIPEAEKLITRASACLEKCYAWLHCGEADVKQQSKIGQ